MERSSVNFEGREYELRFSRGLAELPEAAEIRRAVFVEEQGFANEFDDTDETAYHCLVLKDGVPVATGRLFGEGREAHIGRIAVVGSERGKRIGSLLMSALEGYAARLGFQSTTLAAQCRAEAFYAANGYVTQGDIFYDEHCPHIMMYKRL